MTDSGVKSCRYVATAGMFDGVHRGHQFLLRQLDGAGTVPVCSQCSVPAFGLQEGDSLEGHQEELKNAYQAALIQR